jgi:Protein of unknown function (DUF3618)
MGQTADAIKQEVEAARARLGQNLNELQYRLRSEFDWRVQFARYPWLFIGVAFAGAMLVGMAFRGAPRSTEPACR